MGKKNKKSRAASVEAETGMPRHIRRECLEIINVLLEKCSYQFGAHGLEWSEFIEVHDLVEKLRKKQTNYVMNHSDREKSFGSVLAWAQENSVDTSNTTIAKFDYGGYGLKATKNINMAELFLTIPRKLMMTSDTAKASILGGLIKEDRILQAMPNVALALHVLCERANPESFWTPYIKTLPSSYTTPLYFSPEEIQLFKGSPIMPEILNQFRNITRQYAYFFKLFQGHPEATKLPIKNFCFDDYRWAASTVMTRQNQIPMKDGEQMVMSLIPLWDMCNHTNGQFTTDFSVEKDASECYALSQFQQGDQIFIYYGSRSNAELLLHNGFVYPENQNDRLGIKMGVSKNDPLYAMKAELLSRLSLLPSRTFSLHSGREPVDSDTLAYLRVFSMDQEMLLERLVGEGAGRRASQLRDFAVPVSAENETKAWTFLETRAQLLLRAYPTSIQEDESLLETSDLNEHTRLAVMLRLREKYILRITTGYSRTQKENVDSVMAALAETEREVNGLLEELETEDTENMVSVSWNSTHTHPTAERTGVEIVEITDDDTDNKQVEEVGVKQVTSSPEQELGKDNVANECLCNATQEQSECNATQEHDELDQQIHNIQLSVN